MNQLYMVFVRFMVWCLEFELAIGSSTGMGSHYRAQIRKDLDAWERVLLQWEINQ